MARPSKLTKTHIYQVTKEILIKHGYGGFHFGLLAEKLEVTRAALYKYFDNKDELISQFMCDEMNDLVNDLENLDQYATFDEKLDSLLCIIVKNSKIHQILSVAFQLKKTKHVTVQKNLQHLNNQHEKMSNYLRDFIQKGKREKYLRADLPDHLILGFLLQTVNVSNATHLPDEEWLGLIKSFLFHGFIEK